MDGKDAGVYGTYWNYDQGSHSGSWIIRILFYESRINHKYYAINGNRCFRNVCRKDNLSCTFWGRLEDLGLHFTRQICVNRTDDELCNFIPQSTRCFCEIFLRCFDFVLTL